MADEKGMTALDIRFLVKELRAHLLKGIFRKIVQYEGKQFLFECFVPQRGAFWLYADPRALFLTEYRKPAPAAPPMFCMFLRKYLLGKHIHDITQYDFDRIVEIETEDAILIIELFHPGNVILCDKTKTILMPLQIQRWKDREIKPKHAYTYPPKATNPFEMELDQLVGVITRSDKKLVAVLSSLCGLGSLYAREVCKRAGVDDQQEARQTTRDQATAIHTALERIASEPMAPRLYSDAASPFPLRLSEGKEYQEKATFSAALDEFFSSRQIAQEHDAHHRQQDEQRQKRERILRTQQEAKGKWERIATEAGESGNAIYQFYGVVEAVIAGLQEAKQKGLSWQAIKSRIAQESPEAITEIREHHGIVVVRLGGKDIEIDFTKSVEENAARYYEEAKRARQKLERLQTVRRDQEKKAPRQPPISLQLPLTKRTRKKWYEKFKWFVTSDGFLVVAGRDAATNELLIKNHLEAHDLVFHADIQGAAFVVLKTERKPSTDAARTEAAQFAAANSKAWSRGLGAVDVYAVTAGQVSKTPPSGEVLPKGSFMITGEREWFRNMEITLSIGVIVERGQQATVIAGPVSAVRKHTAYVVTIGPGGRRSIELSTEIRKQILLTARPEDKPLIQQIPLEDFQKQIPSGMGDILDAGGRPKKNRHFY